MSIITLNNRAINRSDTASAGQVWTATSATAADFQDAGGGKIGQVVTATKTDDWESASATWVDLTDMTVNITPSASSSKVFIMVSLGSWVNSASNARGMCKILRDSTTIAVGDAATGEEATFNVCFRSNDGEHHQTPANFSWLDSPSTTSQVTYKLQVQRGPDAQGSMTLNRPGAGHHADGANTASAITVMEVLA